MLAVVENDVRDNRFCPTYQNRRQGQEIAAFTFRERISLKCLNAKQVSKQRCCRIVVV